MKKIVVDQLTYRYPGGTYLALDHLSFDVEEGEIIGIVGRNLSGKSTLAQAIVGLVPHFYRGAYGGRVLVDGVEVFNQTVSDMSRTVGLVFQNPFTQLSGAKLTVYEEVAFGLENLGIPRAEMAGRIDTALSLLGLDSVKDHHPFDLSGGQMQRLAIAGIIAMRPEVIVLDEPTSQLDPLGTEEVFQAVRKLSEEGKTILLIEHKLEKLARFADRILWLDGGRIVAYEPPGRLISRGDLAEHGLKAPIYTRICQRLGVTMENGKRYPITLEETVAALREWKGEQGLRHSPVIVRDDEDSSTENGFC